MPNYIKGSFVCGHVFGRILAWWSLVRGPCCLIVSSFSYFLRIAVIGTFSSLGRSCAVFVAGASLPVGIYWAVALTGASSPSVHSCAVVVTGVSCPVAILCAVAIVGAFFPGATLMRSRWCGLVSTWWSLLRSRGGPILSELTEESVFSSFSLEYLPFYKLVLPYVFIFYPIFRSF